MISGFIIPYSISVSFPQYSLVDFPSFAMRRILRLEPPYIVSAVLVISLWHISAMVPGFAGSTPPVDPRQALAHIAYLIPFTNYAWYQPVYWTLAYEFAFYMTIGLAFPFVCAAERRLVWLIVSAFLICLVWAGVVPPHALLFAIGIAIFRTFREPLEKPWANIIVLGAAGVIARSDMQIATVGLLTAATLHYFCRLQIDGVLGSILLGLGSTSYSLYLTHVPVGGRVVNFGRRWIDGPWAEFALSLAALAVCIAFAYIFMKLVEFPPSSWRDDTRRRVRTL